MSLGRRVLTAVAAAGALLGIFLAADNAWMSYKKDLRDEAKEEMLARATMNRRMPFCGLPGTEGDAQTFADYDGGSIKWVAVCWEGDWVVFELPKRKRS